MPLIIVYMNRSLIIYIYYTVDINRNEIIAFNDQICWCKYIAQCSSLFQLTRQSLLNTILIYIYLYNYTDFNIDRSGSRQRRLEHIPFSVSCTGKG